MMTPAATLVAPSTLRPALSTAPARRNRALLLSAVVVAATSMRVLVGAPHPAASIPAALIFATLMLVAAVIARRGLQRPTWTGAALGIAGGAALMVVALVGLPAVDIAPRATATTLTWWVPLVSSVAAVEELMFRGVLYSALQAVGGEAVALAVTAVMFAAIHVPLYGLQALPIDLCAGLFLGALRTISGGVTAPLVAHVIADVATAWVP